MGGTIFSAFAFLGGPGWAFSKGAASFYILVYCTLGLMPWYIIGPKVARIGKKNDYITMGDFLGDRYQSKVLTILVGIVAVLAFIPYLTLQIKGMAYIFNVLTYNNIPYWLGALLSFGIVVIYVATSGVRGAAWSDVFQAILMLIIAWVLGTYFVESLHGGIENMFKSLSESQPEFLLIGEEGSQMSKNRYSSNIIVSMIGFVMWPHLFTKSYTTTEKRIKTTVAVYPIFALFLLPVLFIGFSGINVVSKDELDNAGQILPYLITNHLTESGLLYGIVGAGALAAAMSSSDAISLPNDTEAP
jgi:SSS family solute:Na+ symporter